MLWLAMIFLLLASLTGFTAGFLALIAAARGVQRAREKPRQRPFRVAAGMLRRAAAEPAPRKPPDFGYTLVDPVPVRHVSHWRPAWRQGSTPIADGDRFTISRDLGILARSREPREGPRHANPMRGYGSA